MMNLISRDELREKLERGDNFKLLMVLGEWAYKAQHIPGSINMNRIEDAATLDKAEEIVVYCTGGPCIASRTAYTYLVEHGFTNVRRYAGGLEDWVNAGFPIEGEMVGDTQ